VILPVDGFGSAPLVFRMPAAEYTVVIRPHGRVIRVKEGHPLLEAALRSGLNLPHSCKSGHCGSCRARLLAGDIDYPNGPPLGLSEGERQDGNILLCRATARSDLTLEARLVASRAEAEIKTLPCRIARIAALAPDVLQVFLRIPAVETLPFAPGQYIDILLGGGRRRSFSLACPPHDSGLLELHVRKVAGGLLSERLSGSEVGMLLRIEGPFGQFVYQPGPAPVLMIAGGTGFAPLKSMLRHALESGVQRPIQLYWGARRSHDLYEEQQVLEWVARYPNLRFTGVLSEAPEANAAHRRLGWVHEAVLEDHPSLEGFDVYAAGPPALIDAIRARYPSRGLGEGRLFFDSFDYASDPKPVA
jgi:CDP-4-dehydro-6-deoxyglucose reductase